MHPYARLYNILRITSRQWNLIYIPLDVWLKIELDRSDLKTTLQHRQWYDIRKVTLQYCQWYRCIFLAGDFSLARVAKSVSKSWLNLSCLHERVIRQSRKTRVNVDRDIIWTSWIFLYMIASTSRQLSLWCSHLENTTQRTTRHNEPLSAINTKQFDLT